jgi:hypothetical protein
VAKQNLQKEAKEVEVATHIVAAEAVEEAADVDEANHGWSQSRHNGINNMNLLECQTTIA